MERPRRENAEDLIGYLLRLENYIDYLLETIKDANQEIDLDS